MQEEEVFEMRLAEFETKLNRSCLHIYKEEHYEEDYQMPMLRQNRLAGILEVEGCEVDGKARYTYEISGLTSMKNMYENASIKKQEIEAVIARILEVTETLQRYMLDPNCLVLKPEYIFYKEGQWFFCYFPGMEEDLCKIFHELTEYFVKMLDYEDTEGIFLAYELHKATLQEHYDLELIMKEYKGREAERKKFVKDKQKGMRMKSNKGTVRRKPVSEGTVSKKMGNGDGIYGKKEESGGAGSKERMGYSCGNQSGTGIEYRNQRDAGDEYRDQRGAGDEYGNQRRAGDEYEGMKGTGTEHGNQKSRNNGYGIWEEADYGSHGNIFSVDDEEEQGSNGKHFSYEKNEELYEADTIREDGAGGWWKSWRKAANGIRRKRWGNWDDLILETDGQEEES